MKYAIVALKLVAACVLGGLAAAIFGPIGLLLSFAIGAVFGVWAALGTIEK